MNKYVVQSLHPRFDHRVEQIDDLQDDLGRKIIAQTIAGEIRGNKRPRVIGVYGSWGAGKSYLLSQVIKELLAGNQDSKQVIVCVFNPWLYEMEGGLAPGLIKSLYNLEKQFPGRNPLVSDTKIYKEIADSLLDLLVEIGPALMPGGQFLVTALGKMAQAALRTVDEYNKVVDSALSKPAVDEVKDKMQKLVNAILDAAYKQDASKEYRLVIFIDDLDRCSPENMVRMFEWLKVHLLVEGCIYVLALDHIAAARAIVGRYKEYLGEERDLAYGFRYLEKLVESEYELGTASNVELMALRQVFGANTPYKRVSEIARNLRGGDFPGVRSIDELLELRSLLVPRTMLKIVYKFKRAMDVLLTESTTELRNQLPSSYPFWTLLLIAMYYRLDPNHLDEFVRGRGIIHNLMKNPGSVPSDKWGNGPLREFCQYADRFGASTGASMQLPQTEHLFRLTSVIRENSFDQSLYAY